MIRIEVIPHAQQRYPTVGDYWWRGPEGRFLEIRVSDLGDWRMNACVALHELVEALLCYDRGIPEPDIKAFDEAHLELDEPGADARAPYHKEHMFADGLERLFALALGVNWTAYGEACDQVSA